MDVMTINCPKRAARLLAITRTGVRSIETCGRRAYVVVPLGPCKIKLYELGGEALAIAHVA